MSIPWGPALDAELAYRQQQARNDFQPWSSRRKPANVRGQALAEHVATQPVSAPPIPAHHIPAQRGPVPLIPLRPRPIDQELPSVHAA